MASHTNKLIISESMIDKLVKNQTDQNIENKHFKYLGKGQEGVVFVCDDKVVKIYTRIDMNAVLKEFYVVGTLQELNNINKNVIHIDKYYLSLSHPVMVMELMDGELENWCDMMAVNKYNLNTNEYETMWMSMLFQVTYGMMFLNKLKILHSDAKTKNILYSESESLNIIERYAINNQIFNVPINRYIFKIADFGAVQILGSKMNTMTDEDIQRSIENRTDLYELSRIWYRILVNYGRNDYGWQQITPLVNSNKQYKKYYNEQKIKIDNEMSNATKKARNSMLRRSLIYYGIENNIIDANDIITKYSLVPPSNLVMKTLDGLVDITIKNVFDLFQIFRV